MLDQISELGRDMIRASYDCPSINEIQRRLKQSEGFKVTCEDLWFEAMRLDRIAYCKATESRPHFDFRWFYPSGSAFLAVATNDGTTYVETLQRLQIQASRILATVERGDLTKLGSKRALGSKTFIDKLFRSVSNAKAASFGLAERDIGVDGSVAEG